MRGTLGVMADRRIPKVRGERISKQRTGPAKRDGRLNLRAVAEVLADAGLDPTTELVKIIKSNKLDLDVQAKLLTTLMEYVHPKKKSVEITGHEGGPVQIEHVPDNVLVQIAMQGLAAEVIEEDEPHELLPEN